METDPVNNQEPDSCPRCEQLRDELMRSEQRSHERLKEISNVCTELQNRLSEGERKREEARQRLAALHNRLRSA